MHRAPAGVTCTRGRRLGSPRDSTSSRCRSRTFAQAHATLSPGDQSRRERQPDSGPWAIAAVQVDDYRVGILTRQLPAVRWTAMRARAKPEMAPVFRVPAMLGDVRARRRKTLRAQRPTFIFCEVLAPHEHPAAGSNTEESGTMKRDPHLRVVLACRDGLRRESKPEQGRR
jgi:hypothetical protein